MKAIIGKRQSDRLVIRQFDARSWWQEHRAAIVGWLLVAALWGYVAIQVFDTGLRH